MVHRHLIELRGLDIVLLDKLTHVVEGTKVIHAGSITARDAHLIAKDEKLRHVVAIRCGHANALVVPRDEGRERSGLARERCLAHLPEERVDIHARPAIKQTLNGATLISR